MEGVVISLPRFLRAMRIPARLLAPSALLAACLVLSACRDLPVLPPAQSSALPPTLAPTLDLGAPVEPVVTPSPVFVFEPVDQAAAVELIPSDPTPTITPWPSSSPTAGPSPTPTRTSTATRVPTRTRAPTSTPTVTFTPTPPAPALNIVRPGLMSKVTSPIQMEVYVVSGHEGVVTIELVGENGRVISRKVIDYGGEGRVVWDIPELPFEIEAVAEMARLQVTTTDAFNRIITRSSVDILLLSVGRSEINPAVVVQAPYLIRQPKKETTITGGTLLLEGLARPVNESPLMIELVRESGQVIAVKRLDIPAPTGSLSHTPFTVELPYSVKAATPVRLVVRQEGSRIPGTVAQTSLELILEP